MLLSAETRAKPLWPFRILIKGASYLLAFTTVPWNWRTRLFEKLEAYVVEVRQSGVVAALIVDGSFVTADDNPGDIDLVLVLSGTHDFTSDLGPMQYNVLSHRRVRARYGFDVFVAREDSKEYQEYVEFFQQVRGAPQLQKAVLRVRI